jgi:hypothetical protein
MSRLLIEYLISVGIPKKKSHSSALDTHLADKVREHFRADRMRTQVAPAALAALASPSNSLSPARPAPVVSPGARSDLKQPASNTTAGPVRGPFGRERVVPDIDSPTGGLEANPVRGSGKNPITITLPERFTFYPSPNFDRMLEVFDWTLSNTQVTIDLTNCRNANFQALSLLVPYLWKLTAAGCTITLKYGRRGKGASGIMEKMGATAWKEVLLSDDLDFEPYSGQRPGRKILYALRQRSDVKETISRTRSEINNFEIEFPNYLSYVVSELLYNATEHGRQSVEINDRPVSLPAILQLRDYSRTSRLSFIFVDLGIGIKAHLEQAYPAHRNHCEAIMHSLQPNVSGTFGQSAPYAAKDNAGMGLTISSRMLKRLKADMYIVSYDGVVHISPEDITSRQLRNTWPGTIVLVELDLRKNPSITLDELLNEIRTKAYEEVSKLSVEEKEKKFYLNVFNHFGRFAEDKDAAIHFRDKYLLQAIEDDKVIEIDFQNVETAPHSFLSALLATPIQRMGIKAYKRVRPLNASGSIRQIFDGILDANTPKV